MKTLRQHRLLLGWFMTFLMIFVQPAASLQGATFLWAPGGNPGNTGSWDTTTSNWSGGGSTWVNANDSVAQFTAGPNVTVNEAITLNKIDFNSAGEQFFFMQGSGSLNFAGASPSIVISGESFSTPSIMNLNVALGGTGGLTIQRNPAQSGKAILNLGSAGISKASTLTGGVTVTNDVTLRVQANSLDLNSSRNPLGYGNTLTLQAGSKLEFAPEFNQLGTGLSGRLFETNGTGNSSRVDFSQTATGLSLPAGSIPLVGSISPGPTHVTLAGVGLNGNINTTAVRYQTAAGVTATATRYAIQWVSKVNVTTAGEHTFLPLLMTARAFTLTEYWF
ncbi:MAG: hypothetical protein R3F13_16310 [Prosthecobacter sp.]